jgi:hypothetical protein
MKGNRGNRGEVDVKLICLAALDAIEAGETWTSLCYRIGWIEPRGIAETSRLKRRLGLMSIPRRRPSLSMCSRGLRYETALTLIEALNLDPMDFGL